MQQYLRLLIVFSLVCVLAMVSLPGSTFAAAKMTWSEVKKGSYNQLSPYTLNWTGDVMDRGGLNLATMKVTTDSSQADFVITESGSIGAGAIVRVNESLEEETDLPLNYNFKTYESVAQGAVYIIVLHDDTWVKLRIDQAVESYMGYISKVSFSYVLEDEIIEDEVVGEVMEFEDTLEPMAGDFLFDSPELDLINATDEYIFEEGPIEIVFPAMEGDIAFDVFRSDNGGPYTPVSDFLLEEPVYVDNYAFAGHTYLYVFVAYDEYGDYYVDAPIKVTVIAKEAAEVKPAEQVIVMTLGSTTASVNGKNMQMDSAPIIVNERTMVPVRFIAEALGAAVVWDSQTSTATITLGNKVIKLTLNSSEAMVNGQKLMMDVPATSINGRTMVPVRFVSENLDQEVSFDSVTREITIISGTASVPPAASSSGSSGSTELERGSLESPQQDGDLASLNDVVGVWEMWIPSLDPNVKSASGGILTIASNQLWQNAFNGAVTSGSWEIDDSGRMVLLEYMFGWDWYVSPTAEGIQITSPPAAFQVGTRVN